MLLKIEHLTEYSYSEPVAYALQRIKLVPQSGPTQHVKEWKVVAEGMSVQAEYADQFGNKTQLVSSAPFIERIVIVATGEVETKDTHGVVGSHEGLVPLWVYARETPLTRPGTLVGGLAKSICNDGDLNRLHALMETIAVRVAYETGTTGVATPAEDALRAEKGVCQDHAHIFIAAARMLGFPSRYVSGYLRMKDREEQTAAHAWAEAHVPELGWVGFDPANGICPDEHYVRVAIGLDYRDAAPISGIRSGFSTEKLAVSVHVQQ
ncbi:transglutaminase family protein [Limoniibacter endophyticus]|uniref:Transglutaminase n=1 Tax=Limoniibacter endophyticus TaxID=1565040 RepID=A0A8J3DTK7_9HYPH|nr:transglutaminase family protein [Limoniibacter endophyticus]GHC81320.1 transglutaminase [Limoniibacter endophyticus]